MLQEQGKQYLINQKIYTHYFGFPNLQLPSSQNVNSIIENMENLNSSVDYKSKSEALDKYEKMFQKALREYNQTYKQLNEERLQKIETLKQASQYLGKVVSEEDGSYHYVNDYGFTHKYSTDAWQNNNQNCPSDTTNASSTLFRQGPDMVPGQPCKIAGKNIKNLDTNEVAWVDIKGYKHVYSEDIWNKKSNTCNIKTIDISNENYVLIPEGSPMQSTDICDTIDINPNLWKKLFNLNKKLISLAQKMSKEIQKLEVKEEVMKELLQEQRNNLDTYVVNLNEDQNNMKFQKRTFENVSGEKENSDLIMISNRSVFFISIIILVLFLFFTIKIVNSNNISPISTTIIIILSIIFLFFVFRRLKNINL
jgi:hypothetical protein